MLQHPCPASGFGKPPHFFDKHICLKNTARGSLLRCHLARVPLHILCLPAVGPCPGHFCSAVPQMANDGLQGDAIRRRGGFLLDVVRTAPPGRSRLTRCSDSPEETLGEPAAKGAGGRSPGDGDRWKRGAGGPRGCPGALTTASNRQGLPCLRVFHLSPKYWHFDGNVKLQENKLRLARAIKPHNAEDKQKETELHLLFCPST